MVACVQRIIMWTINYQVYTKVRETMCSILLDIPQHYIVEVPFYTKSFLQKSINNDEVKWRNALHNGHLSCFVFPPFTWWKKGTSQKGINFEVKHFYLDMDAYMGKIPPLTRLPVNWREEGEIMDIRKNCFNATCMFVFLYFFQMSQSSVSIPQTHTQFPVIFDVLFFPH